YAILHLLNQDGMIKVQLSRANKAKLNLWRKAMPKETFADRLKDALNRQGMKQVDVIRAASQAGVKLGKSHMSQYVSGKTIPREEILRFLAKTLQVTPEWLAGGESEPE